ERKCCSVRLCRQPCRSAKLRNRGHLVVNQIGRQSGKPLVLIPGEAIFDSYVLILDKACVFETLTERDQQLCRRPPLRSAPQSPALPAAARAPRAATRPPRRRAAWLRIFVVRRSLPCDPSGWGHSYNGGMMILRFHPSA